MSGRRWLLVVLSDGMPAGVSRHPGHQEALCRDLDAAVSETVRAAADALGLSKARYVNAVLRAAIRARRKGSSGDPRRDLVGRALHLDELFGGAAVVGMHLARLGEVSLLDVCLGDG